MNLKTLKDYDKNFDVLTALSKKDIEFYNILGEPFRIYGLIDKENYRRLPKEISIKVSDGVDALCRNTSGGRVRFRTDSAYIAVKAFVPSVNLMPHMALAGSLGFDVYERKDGEYTHISTILPGWGTTAINDIEKNGYFDCLVEFDEKRMRDLTINFPLYNDVNDVFVGIEKTANLLPGDEYTNKKTVVYYGSSITQGGCASRPGNCYSHILSRIFDNDFYNLGFSGNAKGEDAIANYIADMNMDVFVYDYDHNTPNPEHLLKTHERMFKIIRDKNPKLPIIMLSSPRYYPDPEFDERREIIRTTYKNALKNGDENVWFIEGNRIYDILGGDSCTVDRIHPNDLGFMCFAEAIKEIMCKVM